MEWLRSWALAAGCAAIAGGLALTLSPVSGIQRVFKIVLSAFFLCCVVVPLVRNPPQVSDFMYPDSATQKAEDIADKLRIIIDERISDDAGSEIKEEILRNLNDLGIIPISTKIYIVTDRYNQDNTSVCAEMILDSSLSSKHDELVSYLKNKLGIDVKLGYQ